MSHSQFDELTPLELDLALKDHSSYMAVNVRQQMDLIRFIGLIQRNMNVKQAYAIREPKEFYRFLWEKPKVVEPLTPADWQALDRKYSNSPAP